MGPAAAAIVKGGAFVCSSGFDPALLPMRDLDVLSPSDSQVATNLLRVICFLSETKGRPSGKHLLACQLAFGPDERVSGLSVGWQQHAPLALGAAELEQAGRLILLDVACRAALSWLRRLLRTSPRRWLGPMLRKQHGVGAGVPTQHGETELVAALYYTVGAEG